ncbi:hypothetical protein [Hirschia maritima]|uniref:hypothetical protein n=1 Tax=Hirschia maritima TaxID=1121961 RepID=UPI0003602BD2|nr:hypothetical protein [Hirschia maritima]
MSHNTNESNSINWEAGPNNNFSFKFQFIRAITLVVTNLLVYWIARLIFLRSPLDLYDCFAVFLIVVIVAIKVILEVPNIKKSRFIISKNQIVIKIEGTDKMAVLVPEDIKFIKTYNFDPSFLILHPAKSGGKKLKSAKIKHVLLVYADHQKLKQLKHILNSDMLIRISGETKDKNSPHLPSPN